jgi:hypothetical protein
MAVPVDTITITAKGHVTIFRTFISKRPSGREISFELGNFLFANVVTVKFARGVRLCLVTTVRWHCLESCTGDETAGLPAIHGAKRIS